MVNKDRAKATQLTFEPELLKIYVDVYKHHFDLWLKGYVFYLAIIGSTAGFIFGKDTSPDTRRFLMLFVVTVSAVSLIAWFVGLMWAKDFAAAVERVAPANSPPLALKAFQTAIILGFVGAVVILSGTLLLYYQGV
jgi:hypothetical protein